MTSCAERVIIDGGDGLIEMDQKYSLLTPYCPSYVFPYGSTEVQSLLLLPRANFLRWLGEEGKVVQNWLEQTFLCSVLWCMSIDGVYFCNDVHAYTYGVQSLGVIVYSVIRILEYISCKGTQLK